MEYSFFFKMLTNRSKQSDHTKVLLKTLVFLLLLNIDLLNVCPTEYMRHLLFIIDLGSSSIIKNLD